MRFELLHDRADIRAMRAQWMQWAARVRSTPFAHPAFFDAWSQAFSSTRSTFLVAGYEGPSVVFLLPMWSERAQELHWKSLGVLRADYTEAVAASDSFDAGFGFWKWLHRDASCQSAKIARMPHDSMLARTAPPQLGIVRELAGATRTLFTSGSVRYLRSHSEHEHPFADRAQIELLSKRIASKDTKRKVTILSRGGNVSYEVVTDTHGLRTLLPTFFAMHVENFAKTGRVSQFNDPRERSLYEALVSSTELENCIYMDVLRVADRIAALHVGFQEHDTIYWYKPAFDMAFERGSPGRVLLAHLFARARAQGVQRVDLLKGLEPYKQDWANQSMETITVDATSAHPRDLARRFVERWWARP